MVNNPFTSKKKTMSMLFVELRTCHCFWSFVKNWWTYFATIRSRKPN
jgi:hypothetical protein